MSLPVGGALRDDDDSLRADNSFAVNSKIMIVAVVVLFGVVMFILGLHIYAKWFWRHGGLYGGSSSRGGWRSRRRLEFAADLQGHRRVTSTHVGLEKSVLDQLPTFTFSFPVNKEGPLECAVCLEEFADGEKGRLLPKCNHSFHIECIDMWFHSHSTCPLCRCSVGPESSSLTTAVTTVVQQPSDASQNEDGDGARPSPSSAVVLNVSDGVAVSGRSSDSRQEGTQAAIVVEQGFYSRPDSAAGAGAGLTSPRQQQLCSRPESPSSRRPSTALSPKSSGMQYPANVLFWGNQTQMNAAGTGTEAGPRDENSRRRRSSGVHAIRPLVIEIPTALPLDTSTVGPAHHHNHTNSSDEANRSSDLRAGAGGPKSPIGRLVTAGFRRLLSRRGPTSPGPEGTCSSFDCEQQPQGSAISYSAETTTVQGSRQG